MFVKSTLTALEHTIKYLGAAVTLPAYPLWYVVTPAAHQTVLIRFGKVDGLLNSGLSFPIPFASEVCVFTGTRSYKTEQLHVNDSTGAPINVSTIVNYHVSDTERFAVLTGARVQDPVRVFANLVESEVRDTCRKYPFSSGGGGVDLRNCNQAVHETMLNNLQSKAAELGLKVDNIMLSQINYAPEVAQQMLVKQQAQAMLEARKLIVEGAIGIVNDVVKNLPSDIGSTFDKSRLTNNLLVSLVSSTPVTPTVQLA